MPPSTSPFIRWLLIVLAFGVLIWLANLVSVLGWPLPPGFVWSLLGS